jgi:hypothetical protein
VVEDYISQKHDKAAAEKEKLHFPLMFIKITNKQEVTLILQYKSLFRSLLRSKRTARVETLFVLITVLWFEL